MQDNQKQNQQLVDRGWQKLSGLLDIEMPEVRKRRRTTAWWFVAAGVMFSLGALGYYSWQDVRVDVLPQTPIVTNDMAETAAATESTSDNVMSENKVSKDQHNSSVTQNAVHTDSGTETTDVKTSAQTSSGISTEQTIVNPKTTVVENTMLNESIAASTSSEESTTAVARSEGQDEMIINNTSSVSQPVQEEFEDATAQRTREQLQTPVLDAINNSIDLIAARENITVTRLHVAIPILSGNPENSLIVPATHPAFTGDFRLEGMAATHVNADGNPFYGVEAGLNTILFSHRRLRLHAGLSYGYYNVDGLGIFSLSLDPQEDEFLGNSGGGNPDSNYTGIPVYAVQDVVDGALEYSEAKQLTEKFHYIHVPLKIEYRITPRFSVMAGAKVSTLLAAPARYRLNDARFSASPQTNFTSGTKSFLYNYDILRKMDIASLIGMSYQIGERWSLDAMYSHGLLHYINNPEAVNRNDFHRSASLGMRYRIL